MRGITRFILIVLGGCGFLGLKNVSVENSSEVQVASAKNDFYSEDLNIDLYRGEIFSEARADWQTGL